MKRTINLLATLVVASIMSLGLSGCGPDEPEQPEPTFIDMSGTSWEATGDNTYTFNYQGYNINMDISIIMILDALDETNAELFIDYIIDVPNSPTASQRETDTEFYTYTFDGDKLILKRKGAGSNRTMVYDKGTNTFTMPINDGQMRTMLNINEIMFHQTRGGQI